MNYNVRRMAIEILEMFEAIVLNLEVGHMSKKSQRNPLSEIMHKMDELMSEMGYEPAILSRGISNNDVSWLEQYVVKASLIAGVDDKTILAHTYITEEQFYEYKFRYKSKEN